MEFDLTKSGTDARLREFAVKLQEISGQIGFKVSARGWCYQMEQERLINKDQFDKVESWINNCRRKGILPIDFTAEEEGRQFSGVEAPEDETPVEYLGGYLEYAMKAEEHYTPNWWVGEEFYIQMLVEKIDLKTLFTPVCERFHIPIATSKGWASMLQRAEYARRFKEAEEKGLKCVLLYCGDFDPDGWRISNTHRQGLEDIMNITWENGEHGYDPVNLQIVRFGLDYDFITKHNLTWVDNLITGSKKDLASESHHNNKMTYVQDYIKKYGVRKCEANAILPKREAARELVEGAITHFVGHDAEKRFEAKRQAVRDELKRFREKTGLSEPLEKALKIIEAGED